MNLGEVMLKLNYIYYVRYLPKQLFKYEKRYCINKRTGFKELGFYGQYDYGYKSYFIDESRELYDCYKKLKFTDKLIEFIKGEMNYLFETRIDELD